MKMKSLFVVGLLVVGVLVAVAYGKSAYFGVSNKALGVPAEFGQTEIAIEQAAASLGAKYCPDKIVQARGLAKEGVEAYWQCQTKEGLAMLDQAILLAVEAEDCTCKPIHFDFDKANLRPDAIAELENALKILQENPSLKVLLEGNADSIGTETYNMALGHRRAAAVFEYLKSKGISDDKMITVSYGEDRPIASNDTEEERAKNRRVEIKPL